VRGKLADPQSFGLAKLIGTGQDSVRVGLSVLLALVIESVCCFGLLVIAGGHTSPVAGGEVAAEWIGRWLSDRADPGLDARVSFADLEDDFRTWARTWKAPHID
jgi:hypothetical protein